MLVKESAMSEGKVFLYRNLWQLRIVVLDGMRVARGPLKDCLPFKRCVELDLSGNLLSSWRVLLDILKFFPSLRYLNVR